jgi:hypothetical protein
METIYYTEDYENIPDEGVVFYNDCDETVMELWCDGKVIASTYISDFCEDIGKDCNDFREDKSLIYDIFIHYCYKQGWL